MLLRPVGTVSAGVGAPFTTFSIVQTKTFRVDWMSPQACTSDGSNGQRVQHGRLKRSYVPSATVPSSVESQIIQHRRPQCSPNDSTVPAMRFLIFPWLTRAGLWPTKYQCFASFLSVTEPCSVEHVEQRMSSRFCDVHNTRPALHQRQRPSF
ncbi:hypothetical protein FA13DRAFT_1406846 [Coprinellus micaceus]|uniref:Uncharacterized protein n=1 Tax=Coprinellus micaceus TaxID=71717 RepID=A0A4Y7SP89_COPMI|nr:hypothetical protein FA13DRAFT_1406846 [Coprinellus micaceus]